MIKRYSLHLLLILICCTSLFGQDNINQLRNEKQKIIDEISFTEKLLDEIKRDKKNSMNELVLTEKKIKQRQQLIKNIESEINIYNRNISNNQKKIKQMEEELAAFQEEYAKLIVSVYKRKNKLTTISFLFASDNFRQAVQRMKYLGYYGSYRKKQGQLIINTQDSIKLKNVELHQLKEQKVVSLSVKEKERKQIEKEQLAQKKIVKQLSTKEKSLRQELRKKEKDAQRLENTIKNIIAQQIRESESVPVTPEQKKEQPSKKPLLKEEFRLTPEQRQLSNNFSSNKQRLPWPTEKGILSSSFGMRSHPVLKHVKVKNNGVDILTHKGASARAVFSGQITHVMTLPGQNYVVFIRHGEYLTVYANLASVSVKAGQQVKTKQTIGVVYTDKDTDKTELHFELWKGKNVMNPSLWLSK